MPTKEKAIVYLHGQGGNAKEAEHYAPLFPEHTVIGYDYTAETPWAAQKEFPPFFAELQEKYEITLIANSIGAYFAMHALADCPFCNVYLISPIVDMEKLISDMMAALSVTEEELEREQMIPTPYGAPLSWEYLCYVRSHPIDWHAPTEILYGSRDSLTSYQTISRFARKIGATLTVMEGGEHWFHTEEQMAFLDQWICGKL